MCPPPALPFYTLTRSVLPVPTPLHSIFLLSLHFLFFPALHPFPALALTCPKNSRCRLLIPRNESPSSLATRSTFVIPGVHAVLIILPRNYTSLASLLLLISLRGTKIIRMLSINPDVASHEVKFDREEWRYKKGVTINFWASSYELVPTSYITFPKPPNVASYEVKFSWEIWTKKRHYYKFLSALLRIGADEVKCNRDEWRWKWRCCKFLIARTWIGA